MGCPSLGGARKLAPHHAVIKITFRNHADAKAKIALELNGEPVEVAFAPHKTLLEVLREDLGLTGTKHGCELGECAPAPYSSTARRSCPACCSASPAPGAGLRRSKAWRSAARSIPSRRRSPELGAAQCGYCTPAFLLAAEALLASRARPTRDEIKQALSGNLCRCTGYIKHSTRPSSWRRRRMRGEDAKPAPETLYGVR